MRAHLGVRDINVRATGHVCVQVHALCNYSATVRALLLLGCLHDNSAGVACEAQGEIELTRGCSSWAGEFRPKQNETDDGNEPDPLVSTPVLHYQAD